MVNFTHRNFYKEAQDKNRVYYEYYHLTEPKKSR